MLDRPDKPNSFPVDHSDLEHLESARPHDWRNPEPAPCYNLVVLGGGPAGLVAARGAVAFGAKVALIEDDMIGGDCLNVGCVPSKCVIRSSRVVGEVRAAASVGVRVAGTVEPDFGAVMERMRQVRARLSHHDSADRFRGLGVDVFLGDLWKQGALVGAAQDEAYYVKCDEETNPPEARDAGQLICEIGISPVKPAEFIVVRIHQWTRERTDDAAPEEPKTAAAAV